MDIGGIGETVRRSMLGPFLVGTCSEAGFTTTASTILNAGQARREGIYGRKVLGCTNRTFLGHTPGIRVVGTRGDGIGLAPTTVGDGGVSDVRSTADVSISRVVGEEIILHLAFFSRRGGFAVVDPVEVTAGTFLWIY